MLSGSLRAKVEDEIVELEPFDALRVHKDTMRSFEGGPEGAELIAIGAPNTGPGDAESRGLVERLTRFVDEHDWGFGWISTDHPRLRIASHALLADGRVWVIDPTEGDGIEERVRALGEPAGVLQLLDRHNRACASFASRLGVPHHASRSTRSARSRLYRSCGASSGARSRSGGRSAACSSRRRAPHRAALLRAGRRAARRPPAPAADAAAAARAPRARARAPGTARACTSPRPRRCATRSPSRGGACRGSRSSSAAVALRR